MFDKIVEAIEQGMQIDVIALALQLLSTIILIIVVRVFFWKPITNYLEKRQETIKGELDEAREKNEEAENLKKSISTEYEEAKKETKDFKKTLQQEAQEEKLRIIQEARDEAKRRLDQVEVDINQEIKKSNEKIKQSIKEIAFAAAEKILQHEIDEEKHEKMIEEMIEDK